MQLNALHGQGRVAVGLEHSSQEVAPPPSQPFSWQPVPTEHPQCQAWRAHTFLHLSLWWPGVRSWAQAVGVPPEAHSWQQQDSPPTPHLLVLTQGFGHKM